MIPALLTATCLWVGLAVWSPRTGFILGLFVFYSVVALCLTGVLQ